MPLIEEIRRDDIIYDLRRIDEALGIDGESGFICIAGSGSLMLNMLEFPYATHDVDVLRCSSNVLHLLNICSCDFNNSVSIYGDSYPAFMETAKFDGGFDNLSCHVITPETCVLMKLVAGRDQDLDHIKAVVNDIDCNHVDSVIRSFDFMADIPSNEEYAKILQNWESIIEECEVTIDAEDNYARGLR